VLTAISKTILGSVVSLVLVGQPISLIAQSDEDVVRQSVGKFCNLEFNGADDPAQREGLIQLSDSRVHQLKTIMNGMSPYVFEWETSPLDVVDSYKIGDVKVLNGEASVIVRYAVVAQRDSWGGQIKGATSKIVSTRLRLRLDGAHWKVASSAASMGRFWFGKSS